MNNKDEKLDKNIKILKALAHPIRFEIVAFLLDGRKCVCEISKKLNYEQPYISKGLKVLKNAGIIRDEKIGLNVYYSLEMLCMKDFVTCLNKQF